MFEQALGDSTNGGVGCTFGVTTGDAPGVQAGVKVGGFFGSGSDA